MESVKETLTGPILKNNPIALQILGICSALAVTSSLQVTLVMCIALTFVTAFANLGVSLIRNHIPGSIRMPAQASASSMSAKTPRSSQSLRMLNTANIAPVAATKVKTVKMRFASRV